MWKYENILNIINIMCNEKWKKRNDIMKMIMMVM